MQKASPFTGIIAAFAVLAVLSLADCGDGSSRSTQATTPTSQWVYYNSSGTLTYKTLDPQGDKIMDFSTAGYEQGAVEIPTAPVEATLSPSGGDDTANIQAAINTVSAMPLNATTGLRGAVLLNPGSYTVSSSLSISASGVVLRGSGSGASPTTNTLITMTEAATPYPMVVLGTSGVYPSYGHHRRLCARGNADHRRREHSRALRRDDRHHHETGNRGVGELHGNDPVRPGHHL